MEQCSQTHLQSSCRNNHRLGTGTEFSHPITGLTSEAEATRRSPMPSRCPDEQARAAHQIALQYSLGHSSAVMQAERALPLLLLPLLRGLYVLTGFFNGIMKLNIRGSSFFMHLIHGQPPSSQAVQAQARSISATIDRSACCSPT